VSNSPEQRQRACEGVLDRVRLPRTLALFSRKLGARFIVFRLPRFSEGRPTDA
jgi:hypothetical protein